MFYSRKNLYKDTIKNNALNPYVPKKINKHQIHTAFSFSSKSYRENINKKNIFYIKWQITWYVAKIRIFN